MATPTSSRRFSRFNQVVEATASPASVTSDATAAHPAAGVVPVGVSASVGHDHWASDVLSAVDSHKKLGHQNEKSGSTGSAGSSAGSSGSGSNSPESFCDAGSDGGQQPLPSATSTRPGSILDHATVVKSKVLEKKRKFHTGRCLELKNLPDGCVEQVRTHISIISSPLLSRWNFA